jgi:hypothetical protein
MLNDGGLGQAADGGGQMVARPPRAAPTASSQRLNGAGSAGRRMSMIRRACAAPMPSCSRSTRNQATSSAGLATILAAARKSLT